MLDIQFDWLNDFVQKIMKYDWRKAINSAISKSIFVIEREAKIQTPVDTWILRNSYITEFDDLIWRLINTREYWLYVHEWTRFFQWNPFIQRAVENTDEKVTMIFSKEYDDLLATLQ